MKACAWTCLVGGSLCIAFLGCSATNGGTGGGVGNTGNGSSAGSPNLGGSGSLAGNGTGAGVSLGGDTNSGGGTGGGCQAGGVEFVPKVPTVLLVVDRSGTMFTQPDTVHMLGNPWSTLMDGVLPVVESLSADVRFGFVSFTGEMGGTCPDLLEIVPAENNFATIEAAYRGLPKPMVGESPGMQAIRRAGEILAADTVVGDKYVLFVTDGEQDYCNNGEFTCPTDSMVWRLQTLAAQGFKTFVFGLPVQSTDAATQARYPLVLQAFADAGAGVPPVLVLPTGAQGPITVQYNCQGVAGWAADKAESLNAVPGPIATYGAASGGAQVFAPVGTDTETLANEFRKVLAGVKSCTFDLGGEIKVIQSLLSEAHVFVQGTEVPLDLTVANGWHMPTPTQIELVGAACENWRMPANTAITWDFPCQILEPR